MVIILNRIEIASKTVEYLRVFDGAAAFRLQNAGKL